MCGIWLSLCNSSPLLPLSAMYSSDLSLALSSAPHALWRLAHDPVTEGDLYARTSPVCSSLRAGPAWAFPRQRCVSVWVLSDWRLGDCRSRSTRTRTHTGANMEMRRASWLPAGLALCLAAAILPSISACDRGDYRMLIGDFCLTKFRLDMEALDRSLWCSWPRTMEIYEDVTNCTFQVALHMGCFWPNAVVDAFFGDVHRVYFLDCAQTGRLLHEPPVHVLAPFIGIPVLVTLLMTALVVWRSQRTQGVL